jgi:hypothetical protein
VIHAEAAKVAAMADVVSVIVTTAVETHAAVVVLIAMILVAVTHEVAAKAVVVTNAANHVQQLVVKEPVTLRLIAQLAVPISKETSLQVQHPAVALAM